MSVTTGRPALVTAPTARPVSSTEIMDYARVTDLDELDQLNRLADAAIDTVQTAIGRQLMTATYDYFLDRFIDPIELPLPPLQSVTSISYIDGNGDTQILSTDVYTHDVNREPGIVYRAYNQSWPAIRSVRDAVTVRYVAGYSDAASVPDTAKTMVLMLINEMYENRLPVYMVKTFQSEAFDRLKYSLMIKEFV